MRLDYWGRGKRYSFSLSSSSSSSSPPPPHRPPSPPPPPPPSSSSTLTKSTRKNTYYVMTILQTLFKAVLRHANLEVVSMLLTCKALKLNVIHIAK